MRRATRRSLGANVFGYLYAASGVGQHTRLLISSLRAAGLPFSAQAFTANNSPQTVEFPTSPFRPELPVTIVGVNADETPHFFSKTELPGDQYKIGLWAWETEDFPESMARNAECLDEIWANSGFSAKAISRLVGKPVHAFPLPIEKPVRDGTNRESFGIDDRFCFLFCFDYDSIFERKNPTGVIEAFSAAFGPSSSEAQLVLKSLNSERHAEHRARVLEQIDGCSAIRLIEENLPLATQHALLDASDCYVSLHRSEGFGLTIGESMALGKPVIATAYSGNLDYMNHGVGELIGYRKVPIGQGAGPYHPESEWAEPDVHQAAEAMRRVVAEQGVALEMGRRAAQHVLSRHGIEARGEWIRERLAAIIGDRAAPVRPSWNPFRRRSSL